MKRKIRRPSRSSARLRQAPVQMARMQVDTLVGMGFSNIIALFIMLTTAATLNAHGVTDIQTSSQAAEALRPIAGRFAFTIFALGIIGTGLLAVPVLAGSAAYAVGEALRWRVGLAQRPGRAPAFYGTIALATLVGAILNFTPLDPIKALFWSAVINGVAAVPIMVMIMLMASRKTGHGSVCAAALAQGSWLARHRGNGGCSHRHVRDVGKLIGPPTIIPNFGRGTRARDVFGNVRYLARSGHYGSRPRALQSERSPRDE